MQVDLDTALKSAERTWGYSVAEKIHVDMEPLNPCRATDHAAIVNVQTTTTTTTTGEPAAPPVVSTVYAYTIHVNSNCKWSQAWLDNVMAHEYGHVLIGAEYHSKDKRSIMYWIVKDRGQFVTTEDRAKVQVRRSEGAEPSIELITGP
jgi:Matrixin